MRAPRGFARGLPMSIIEQQFKAGMRHLAGAVNVITSTALDGERSGMTATAVCSVCASPPTLLVCVNAQNRSHKAIQESGAFAVNLLALRDQGIASAFASGRPSHEKFEHGRWSTLETGAPVLGSALVAFDCRVRTTLTMGTHEVVFGEIVAMRLHEAQLPPLLFTHGAFGSFEASRAFAGPIEAVMAGQEAGWG
ncbi:MAG TPA: flavin reductase family protein [Burkholderiaceae bacterium]|nr:flavin reductase family protein [Burkholderiaceae bacterium]